MMFIQIPDQIIKPPFKQTLRSSLHSLDLTGFGLFAGWTVQLLLALQWGGSAYPWESATIIGLFCGAAANFAIFVAWNYRKGSKALIPVEIIRKQVVWASILSTIFLIGVMLSNAYFMPIYFQAVSRTLRQNYLSYVSPAEPLGDTAQQPPRVSPLWNHC